MDLPESVATAIGRFLDACDAAVPELVVGLFVAGSLALDDYRSDRSDIDVVVVVRSPPDRVQCSLLAGVHRLAGTRIDGPYLTEAALAGPPETVGPVPHHVDGRFEVGDCHEVSPVTWSILAHDAITVRGRSPAAIGVQPNPDSLRAFSAANLRGYWNGWAATIAALVAGTDDAETIETQLLEWGVLGAARVYCAATTGRVISKRAGGEYARAELDPQWRPLVGLALDARAGLVTEVRVGDLRAACAFVRELGDLCAGEIGGEGIGPARGWEE